IVAKGDESSLDEFLTRIRVDKHPASPISVEAIDTELRAATGEFEYFEIRRGDWTEELGERMDVAGSLIYRSVELGIESVGIGGEMLGKQDQMLDKQDLHTHVLTEFRDQTHQNFDALDVKYGKISDNVERAVD
ncbi:MAG: acylphosphatase, partial [Euryarchaeota archaeon]|nr:acylphosphatase [Euryarchaeota archaeon]